MKDIFESMAPVSRAEKEKKLNQHACVLWFVGLSGSGKSTLAKNVAIKLHAEGFLSHILDGDNLRFGLNENLGFSIEDRHENLRRAAQAAKLFVDCGIIAICPLISPTAEIRAMVKSILGKDDYLEIYVDCPLDVCELRDVKGLYAKARKGELQNFTGISSPFEKPDHPFLRIDTTKVSPEIAADLIFNAVKPHITYTKGEMKA